jgi:putative FmdB family regulatory protein
MPIFEFVCHGCGYAFEKLVMSREVSVGCPTCGSLEIVKQFSAFITKTAAGVSGSMGTGSGCPPVG